MSDSAAPPTAGADELLSPRGDAVAEFELYGLGDQPIGYGLPDTSPFVIKTELWMRVAGVKYHKMAGNPQKAPRGKVPWLHHYSFDGKKKKAHVVDDSTLIIEYMSKVRGVNLDEHLTPEQEGMGRAIQHVVERSLYFVTLYSVFQDDQGWATTKQELQRTLPPLLRSIVPGFIRRAQKSNLHGQGLGRLPPDVVYDSGVADLRALRLILGDKPYFFNDRISTYDITAAAFLMHLIGIRQRSPLTEALCSTPVLVAFAHRIAAKYMSDLPFVADAPAFKAFVTEQRDQAKGAGTLGGGGGGGGAAGAAAAASTSSSTTGDGDGDGDGEKDCLTYFGIRGRGEEALLALHIAGAPHEHKVVPTGGWAALKPTTPLGQVPMYADAAAGITLGQSTAILRHIGRKHGLYGADDTERAVIDVVLEQAADAYSGTFFQQYLPAAAAGDDAKQAEVRGKAVAQLGALFAYLAAGAGSGNGGVASDDGFVVRSGVSIADVRLFHVLHNVVRPLGWMDDVDAAAGAAAKGRVAAYYQRLRAHDKVRSFLASDAHMPTTLPPHLPVLNTADACRDDSDDA